MIFWAAISRAVRTPSRTDADFSLNVESPNMRLLIQGNPELKSEILLAYELGYRFNLINKFLLDVSLFYNDYDKLRTSETIDFKPFPPPPSLILSTEAQIFKYFVGWARYFLAHLFKFKLKVGNKKTLPTLHCEPFL